jgi:hypothetical protein
MSTLTTNLWHTLQPRFKKIFSGPSLKVGFKAFGITVLSMWVICEQVHFIKSPTDSMQEHYFVHFAHLTPKKGEITLVKNAWYQGNLIKRIIGVAGDQLVYDALGNLWVGKKCVGKPLTQASNGRILTKVAPGTIPKDHVFLYAPHPKSLDSRYTQVGLVHVHDIKGRLIAVG